MVMVMLRKDQRLTAGDTRLIKLSMHMLCSNTIEHKAIGYSWMCIALADTSKDPSVYYKGHFPADWRQIL